MVEAADGGIDTVRTSLNHTLSAEIEILTYTGLAGEPAYNAAMVSMILGNGFADRAASVTAVDAHRLARSGATKLEDYAAQVPGMAIASNGGSTADVDAESGLHWPDPLEWSVTAEQNGGFFALVADLVMQAEVSVDV